MGALWTKVGRLTLQHVLKQSYRCSDLRCTMFQGLQLMPYQRLPISVPAMDQINNLIQPQPRSLCALDQLDMAVFYLAVPAVTSRCALWT